MKQDITEPELNKLHYLAKAIVLRPAFCEQFFSAVDRYHNSLDVVPVTSAFTDAWCAMQDALTTDGTSDLATIAAKLLASRKSACQDAGRALAWALNACS